MQLKTDKMIARKENGVGWMIFNNPERRNAMANEMRLAMIEILTAYSEDDTIGAVVMTGAGGKAFVSGADISEFEERRSSPELIAEYNEVGRQVNAAFENLENPLIAMIQGFCIGGGVAVALAADIRIAADDTTYAVPAARLGLGYNYPGLKTLTSLVGPSMAKEIFFTARRFTAGEALAMGLVNRVVPVDQLEGLVKEYTDMIKENAPLTIRAAKATVNEVLKDPDDRDLVALQEMIKSCFDSADFTEGRTAFMEKRKPNFTGK